MFSWIGKRITNFGARLEVMKLNAEVDLGQAGAQVYERRAEVLHFLGDLDAALRDYDTAIELDPTLAAAYLGRGTALFSQDLRQEALADIEQSVKLDASLQSYRARARILCALGRTEEAIPDLTRVLEMGKRDFDAFAERGSAYLAAGKLDEAIDDYSEAIVLNRKASEIYEYRGDALLAKEEYDSAVSDYSAAIEMHPSSRGLSGRAVALLRLRDHSRASRLPPRD